MCGSTNVDVDAPVASAEEIEIQKMQLELMQETSAMNKAMQPVMLRSMGYEMDAEGNLIELPEEVDELSELYEQRQLAALRGELDVSPTLERELEDEESNLREIYSRKLGSDYENSTPWQQAYNDFVSRSEELREGSRRGQLKLGEELLYSRMGLLSNLQGAEQSQMYTASGLNYAPTQMGMYTEGLAPYQMYSQMRNQAEIAEKQMETQLKMEQSQSMTSNYGSTMSSCCFIFIAGRGFLHPVVRRFRDEHMTVRNRRGYYWLADRLVPKMKKHKWVKKLVRLFMVDPMTTYGGFCYGYNKRGAVFAPISLFWRGVFNLLGMRPPYRRRGSREVV